MQGQAAIIEALAAIGLSAGDLAFAAAMTFLAALIRGLTGFGMAIILVPLLGLVMEPGQAVVLAIFLQLLIGPVGLPAILAEADRRSALTIGGVALLTTPLGVWLLSQTPPDLARLLIALVAIGAFFLMLFAHKAARRPGAPATVATGLASGVLTGFAAMPGPPVVPYYLRDAFAPRVARASMMLVFFITAIAGTLSSLALGLATVQLALLSLALFLPMTLGNHLGAKAFGKISPALWRSAVFALLLGAGIAALVRLLP